MAQIKNRIKQQLYAPKKSGLFSVGSGKGLSELDDIIGETFLGIKRKEKPNTPSKEAKNGDEKGVGTD